MAVTRQIHDSKVCRTFKGSEIEFAWDLGRSQVAELSILQSGKSRTNEDKLATQPIQNVSAKISVL